MQNIDSTTPATTAPSLAELIAARAEEIAEAERENARRAQLTRENDRKEALTYAYNFMRAHFSPELAEALAMIPAVDDAALDEEEPNSEAGYLMLDVSGAGVDDGDIARADPDRADRWRLININRKYSDWMWMLSGPRGYLVSIGQPYSTDTNLDRGLLDAIAAYPAWLADADKRRATQEERQKRSTPARFIFVSGVSTTDQQRGVLAAGNHVQVTTLDPRESDGAMKWRGVIQAYNAQWLLLNVDGISAGVGAQRLIPLARVQEILPLPDLAPDLSPDAE